MHHIADDRARRQARSNARYRSKNASNRSIGEPPARAVRRDHAETLEHLQQAQQTRPRPLAAMASDPTLPGNELLDPPAGQITSAATPPPPASGSAAPPAAAVRLLSATYTPRPQLRRIRVGERSQRPHHQHPAHPARRPRHRLLLLREQEGRRSPALLPLCRQLRGDQPKLRGLSSQRRHNKHIGIFVVVPTSAQARSAPHVRGQDHARQLPDGRRPAGPAGAAVHLPRPRQPSCELLVSVRRPGAARARRARLEHHLTETETPPMTALAPTLQAFFTDRLITQRHASPHTIASYRDTMRLLLEFAQHQLRVQPARARSRRARRRPDRRVPGPPRTRAPQHGRTRNARLAAIHSLYRFASLAPPRTRRADRPRARDPTQTPRPTTHHPPHRQRDRRAARRARPHHLDRTA